MLLSLDVPADYTRQQGDGDPGDMRPAVGSVLSEGSSWSYEAMEPRQPLYNAQSQSPRENIKAERLVMPSHS